MKNLIVYCKNILVKIKYNNFNNDKGLSMAFKIQVILIQVYLLTRSIITTLCEFDLEIYYIKTRLV